MPEAKTLLQHFAVFVDEATHEAMAEMLRKSQFSLIVRELFNKAPQSTRLLAGTILEVIEECTQDADKGSGDESIVRMETTTTVVNRESRDDFSYRPTVATNKDPQSVRKSVRLSKMSPLNLGNTAPQKHQPAGSVEFSERTSSRQQNFEPTISSNTKVDAGPESPKTHSVGNSAKLATSTISSQTQGPSTPVPSTPVQDQVTSPQTEEVPRDKIPRSLQSLASSPTPSTSSDSTVISPSRTILEAVEVIHELSKSQRAAPDEVHKGILQALVCPNDALTRETQWSDGSLWLRILKAGWSKSKEVTILNMLEYMGFSKYFDDQAALAQKLVRTKKNRPVDRRGAAIHVMNRLQGLEPSGQPGNRSGGLNSAEVREKLVVNDVVDEIQQQERKRINTQLSRGRKLRTKLVKELSFGILFSPEIWKYTKMNDDELDALIEHVKADPQYVRVLQILGQHLELYINNGRGDIHSLLSSLETEGLVSEEEYSALGNKYALDEDAISKGRLNAAVDDLIDDVSTHVLGKRKLSGKDLVAIGEGKELECDIFRRLRRDEWFDGWLIYAAMSTSDKSSFARYSYSIPLDEMGKTYRMLPIGRPFFGFRKKIEAWRSEVRSISKGKGFPLVFFSPVDHKNSHFSLLEINEREGKIYHYDSMTDENVINSTMAISGAVQLTRVGRLVQEEFGDFGFDYLEAPTPQQRDGTSCGVRVARNYARRALGFSVGDWHDVLDPERMRMDIVQRLQISVVDGAMWNAQQRRDSKVRSSKRLKSSTD